MPKPKAAIYCRVSTDKQFDKGGSLETQEERCRAYCERNEYDVIGFYKDVESGGTLKREEFQRIFADAESGKFEVLVVTKIDRLSRSMKDYYSKIINFEKFNVRIAAIDQPEFSTAGATGNFLRNILMAAAEFERDMIKQRTSEGMRAKIAKGEWHGGPLPLGYENNKEEKRLVVNETEAELVKRIFNYYLENRSSKTTANRLNSEGFKTKKGSLFTTTGILKIIQNPVYIGKFKLSVDGTVGLVNGLHRPIIIEKIYQQATEIRESNRVNTYINKKLPNEALFTSILRCGHCGSMLTTHSTTKKGRKYTYYRCLNAMKRSPDACPIKQVGSMDIEILGIGLLKTLGRDRNALKYVLENASKHNEEEIEKYNTFLKHLTSEKAEAQRKRQRLMQIMEENEEARLNTIIDRVREHEESITKIEIQILSTGKAIEALKQPIEELDRLSTEYNYFWKRWIDLNNKDRRKAIKTLVKEFSLIAESETDYILEVELITGDKTRTSTVISEGSKDKVGKPLPYGDP